MLIREYYDKWMQDKNDATILVKSAFLWVIASPVNTAITIGSGVGIVTAMWAYNKYAVVATNPTLSAPTTTNITINNVTKAIEDI